MARKTRVIAGRVALVTGAARGIGAATAQALLDQGVRVAIADLDHAAAEQTATRLATGGREVKAYALDVTDPAAFHDTVAAVGRDLGNVDILVNNAGIMSLGGLLDQPAALDNRQIDVNVRGVIHGLRAVLPGMLARRDGHVVNIASVAGRAGLPYAAVYVATKHAVIGLTEAAHNEYRDSGVSFSYVCPSVVRTELTSGIAKIPYPPPVEATDVANAVVRALLTGRVELYVPRFGRLAHVLPALLPRAVSERVGRWLKLDQVFASVDDTARAAYQDRITGDRTTT